MYILFIVLIAGGPLLAVAFAASLVGLRLPRSHIPSVISRPTSDELEAMHLTARNAAERRKSLNQMSESDHRTPALSGGTWRKVLGMPLSEHRRSVAHRAYRRLARANHPDRNGSNEAMQVINDAWLQAKKELVLP